MAPTIDGTGFRLDKRASVEYNVDTLLFSSAGRDASDRILEKEKEKKSADLFVAGFSWPEMIDAISDVYMGVCFPSDGNKAW